MKKIAVCIGIAVISLIISVISFAVNDYSSYRMWMRQAGPQMMKPFPGWHRDDKRPVPPPPPRGPAGNFRDDREHHRESRRDMDRRDYDRPAPAPAAPAEQVPSAPAPDAPAAQPAENAPASN